MTFSDAIYGLPDRFVSRVRLNTMLDHEYDLYWSAWIASLELSATFFVFADTVCGPEF